MNILGISCYYHDAAACLLKDGDVVAAVQEERFTRKKHDFSFPINAVKYCLKEGKISIQEINYVAFYDKPMLKFERLLYQHLEKAPLSYWAFYQSIPTWISEKLRVLRMIRKKLKYKGEVIFSEHHLSHAASAFLCSPYKEAAILTIDGVGEWVTTSLGYGKENEIKILKEIYFPHSLGLLYSTLTAYLGFKVNNGEYKVMGLSAYGEPIYIDRFRKLIDVKEDGSYKLNMEYFDFHYKLRMPSKRFIQLFGPPRKPKEKITEHYQNMAATLQAITEEVVLKMLNHLYEITGMKKVCLAGGVALNSVCNGKILRKTKFEDVYIQPAASDAGSALGCALLTYNSILDKPRSYVMKHTFLGPGYDNKQIKEFLDKNNIMYKEFNSREELLKTVAKLIFENKIVGWFQGRMEWGPRALGARSILANPCNPEMKDILNKRVKHREEFRPFAPVVPIEDVAQWFECDNILPLPTDFMLMVYPIKEEKRKLIPAVVHVDGTGRLQTIRREQNPLYYDLIREFEKISNVPVLINTSFNIKGEPIVCSPYDAYRCMMGTGIDCTVMGNYLIWRKDNPKDMWESYGTK